LVTFWALSSTIIKIVNSLKNGLSKQSIGIAILFIVVIIQSFAPSYKNFKIKNKKEKTKSISAN
jgi:hypothetical protein